MHPRAIITGITGQDGSYLADLLLSKGYLVIGVSRRRSGGGDWRIAHLKDHPNFILESGDVTDVGSLTRVVRAYDPHEFYNLAAQSFVHLSWTEPTHTASVTALGVLNCLETLHLYGRACKFYQASSSELYGKVVEMPQTETTPFYPRSPYGVSKLFGYWSTKNYRESYNMYTTNGILFNHESPRRGLEFVTRKITDAAARIKVAGGGKIRLGNLDARRDWGHASDYMEAAWLMLQQDKPDDFVIATGKAHSIKDVLQVSFTRLGLKWEDYVEQDPSLIRPAEVDILLGNPAKAKAVLNWQPRYDFEQLITEMVDEDYKRHKNGLTTS